MKKKSFKAWSGHHTDTNRRNVLRSQGSQDRYWRKYWKRRAKSERKRIRRRAKNIIGDLVLFAIFLAILAGIFWLGMKK